MGVIADYGNSTSGTAPDGYDQFLRATANDVADVRARQGGAAAAGRAMRGVMQAPLVAAVSPLPDVRDMASAAGRAVVRGARAVGNFAGGFFGDDSDAARTPTAQAPGAPPVSAGTQGAPGPISGYGATRTTAPLPAAPQSNAPATGNYTTGYSGRPLPPEVMNAALTAAARDASGPISAAARQAPPNGGGYLPAGSMSVDPSTGRVTARPGNVGGESADDPIENAVRALGAAPGATSMGASNAPDAQGQPSNVRAYLPVHKYYMPAQPAAPTVDPAQFASNMVAMRTVDPSASLGQAVDAHVMANTYAKNYLAALREAQGGYTGETGRITALANANLAGANADLAGANTDLTGARIGQTEAQTADTQAGTDIKRYSLDQQRQLQALTLKLQDPNLTPTERRNLEQQLWILHGRPPRPDNRYEVSRGAVDVMTGQRTPDIVLDRSTGEVRPLDRSQYGDAKGPPSDPQAEARAAVAAGADKAKVNQRLRLMGQPEIN